jgi:hypothetical protein
MKSTLALIALAAALFVGTAESAHADSYRSNNYGKCETPRYQPAYCKPYKVSTCEIKRSKVCRTGYDHCGKPYTYHVTVVTYRDSYSDGSYKTWTRTLS